MTACEFRSRRRQDDRVSTRHHNGIEKIFHNMSYANQRRGEASIPGSVVSISGISIFYSLARTPFFRQRPPGPPVVTR